MGKFVRVWDAHPNLVVEYMVGGLGMAKEEVGNNRHRLSAEDVAEYVYSCVGTTIQMCPSMLRQPSKWKVDIRTGKVQFNGTDLVENMCTALAQYGVNVAGMDRVDLREILFGAIELWAKSCKSDYSRSVMRLVPFDSGILSKGWNAEIEAGDAFISGISLAIIICMLQRYGCLGKEDVFGNDEYSAKKYKYYKVVAVTNADGNRVKFVLRREWFCG